jgi:cell division protein ZapD
VSDTILYEHPLNERTRNLLRLESFFLQMQYFLEGRCFWDSQSCVTALVELLNYLDRHDLRSDLLKELEKHFVTFSRLTETPAIHHERLQATLEALKNTIKQLKPVSLKITQDLRAHELLNIIRQRITLLGTSCSFDVPAYHQWLNQPKAKRVHGLEKWLKGLQPLYAGIELLLRIIRNSGTFEEKCAESGFYQCNLDPQAHCHLVRVRLPANALPYPEVSGSRHRVTIRFLAFPESGRPKQTGDTIDFDVSFCIL